MRDWNVESSFEKKSSPIEITRKMGKNDMPHFEANLDHDTFVKMKI